MKKMKRLVAVLLTGIMALAMLTACGVTPSAPSMRDTALERDVAQWTVELGKNQNLTLTLDSELTEISNKCLPTAVKAVDARLAFPKDQNAYNDAVKKRETFFAEAKKGKNGCAGARGLSERNRSHQGYSGLCLCRFENGCSE